MTQIIPAGYVVEYQPPGAGHMLCYSFSETRAAAMAAARAQFMGDLTRWHRMNRMGRVRARDVGADEASEIVEMLETPW